MTISAVGTLASNNTTGLTTLAHTNSAIGNCLVVGMKISSLTITISSISGGGATGWTRIAGPNNDGGRSQEFWLGRVTATGAQTITVTFSASNTGLATDLLAQEFSSTLGTGAVWAADGPGAWVTNAASTIVTYPRLSPSGEAGLYVGQSRFVAGGGTWSGLTAGFTAQRDTNLNSFIYGTAITAPVTPTETNTTSAVSANLAAMITDSVNASVWQGGMVGRPRYSTGFDVEWYPGSVILSAPGYTPDIQPTTMGVVGTGFERPTSIMAGFSIPAVTYDVNGTAPSSSSAAGTMGLTGVLTGSAPASSSADGTVAIVPPAGALGTPYLVATNTVSGATTVATPVAQGDAVIAIINNTISFTLNSVTDSKGNTYNLVRRYNSAGSYNVEIWAALNATALTTSDTITPNWATTGGSPRQAYIGCSGVAAASAIDSGGQAAVNGSSASPNSGATGALAQAVELAIGAIADANAGGAVSWNSPWNSIASVHTGTTQWLGVATQNTSSTSAINASGTIVSASWTAMAVTLKGAGATVFDINGSAPAVSNADGTMGLNGVLAGSSVNVSAANGSITALGVISGSSAPASSAAGTVTRTAIITGSAPAVSAANGTMGLNGVLAGSAPSASAASGTVTRTAIIAGSSSASSVADATVVLIGVVAGSSATVGSATGTLGRISPVAGSSATTSQGSGAVTIVTGAQVYPVAGSALSASSAAGTLSLTGVLAGSAAAASSAAGTITRTAVISGSALAVSSAAGTFGLLGVLTGSASSLTAASGNLTATLRVAGSSLASSSGSGTVGRLVPLAGSAASASSGSGAVTIVVGAITWPMAGSAAASSLAAGTVAAVLKAVGSSLTASSGSGSVVLAGRLSGAATAVSVASGALGAGLVLSGSAVSGSRADGHVSVVAIVSGLAESASLADGTIAPPFIPGALPDKITAIVFVVSGPRVTIGVSSISAWIEINKLPAGVGISPAAGGVTTDSLHAEVT